MTFEQSYREFIARRNRAKETPRIDNSKLYAGSPMYYYCDGCGYQHLTLPEDHSEAPKRYCLGCEIIRINGWWDRLKKTLKENNDE